MFLFINTIKIFYGVHTEQSECVHYNKVESFAKVSKYMKDFGNSMGTNDINDLTSLKFFLIAMAIQKNLCLAFPSYHLFLERKELLELPLILRIFLFSFRFQCLNPQNQHWKSFQL